jgi:hypothetical protein
MSHYHFVRHWVPHDLVVRAWSTLCMRAAAVCPILGYMVAMVQVGLRHWGDVCVPVWIGDGLSLAFFVAALIAIYPYVRLLIHYGVPRVGADNPTALEMIGLLICALCRLTVLALTFVWHLRLCGVLRHATAESWSAHHFSSTTYAFVVAALWLVYAVMIKNWSREVSFETQLEQCLTDLGLTASSQVTFAVFVKAIYLIQVAGIFYFTLFFCASSIIIFQCTFFCRHSLCRINPTSPSSLLSTQALVRTRPLQPMQPVLPTNFSDRVTTK